MITALFPLVAHGFSTHNSTKVDKLKTAALTTS